MAFGNVVWSNDRIELVIKMIKLGLSTTDIAENMNTTRNSIIGICTRRNILLNGRRTSWKEAQKTDVHITKERPLLRNLKCQPLPPERKIDHKPLSLMQITGKQCRYIIGEPRNMTCCGKPIMKSDYCPMHYQICYVPGSEYKRKQPEYSCT